MAERNQRSVTTTKPVKAEVVYKNRKIHWIIKGGGYICTSFLGVVYFSMLVGSWFGLESSNEDAVLMLKVLGAVAFALAIVCWKLADSLLSGD